MGISKDPQKAARQLAALAANNPALAARLAPKKPGSTPTSPAESAPTEAVEAGLSGQAPGAAGLSRAKAPTRPAAGGRSPSLRERVLDYGLAAEEAASESDSPEGDAPAAEPEAEAAAGEKPGAAPAEASARGFWSALRAGLLDDPA